MKWLFVLLLAVIIFGGAAWFGYDLLFKQQIEVQKEQRGEIKPEPTPDISLPEFQAAAKLRQEGKLPGCVYPTPDELWNLTFAKANAWRDRFAAVPYPDKSGTWDIRFYQEISVCYRNEGSASVNGFVLPRKICSDVVSTRFA